MFELGVVVLLGVALWSVVLVEELLGVALLLGIELGVVVLVGDDCGVALWSVVEELVAELF